MEDDFDSNEYFIKNRQLLDSEIHDFSHHIDCFARSSNPRNIQLAQTILELGQQDNGLIVSYLTSTADVFNDDIDITLANLNNLLKMNNTVRASFVQTNYQKILEILSAKNDNSQKLMTLINAVLVKTLTHNVIFEENSYSVADKICDIYLTVFKSLVSMLESGSFNERAPYILMIFLKIYEIVIEPIIYTNLYAENKTLNYVIFKLQNVVLKSLATFKNVFLVLDLHFRINVLFLVTLALIFEKRILEKKAGPIVNPFVFQVFSKQAENIQYFVKSAVHLCNGSTRVDSSLIKKLCRIAFYLSEFIIQADDRANLAENVLELILENLSPNWIKNCLPQAVVKALPSLAADKCTKQSLKALEKLAVSKAIDPLAVISILTAIEMADKEDIQNILQVPEIIDALKDKTTAFCGGFSVSFLFFSVRTSQGPFYRTHFEVLHRTITLSTIQNNSQVALLKMYIKKLSSENYNDFLENLQDICEEVDIKSNFLYLLVLVCCILKNGKKIERYYFSLYEKIKEHLFEYSQALEDDNSQKFALYDIVFKHSRKFSKRLEQSSPEIALKIRTLLKNFCLNQKDVIGMSFDNHLSTIKSTSKKSTVIVDSKAQTFQKIFSVLESAQTLKTMLVINQNTKNGKFDPDYYMTNNNYFLALEDREFKISPAYELCGLIDPVQLIAEIIISNAQLYTRVSLTNASGTLIKNLVIKFTYWVSLEQKCSETIRLDNFAPSQRKVYTFKLDSNSLNSIKIMCEACVRNLDRHDEELLLDDDEDVGDTNKVTDSMDSDDMNAHDCYNIYCQPVEIKPLWYFYQIEAKETDNATKFAKKAFHLKFEKELDADSPKLGSFYHELGIGPSDCVSAQIFKSVLFDKFFVLWTSEAGLQKTNIIVKTHSKKVFQLITDFFN